MLRKGVVLVREADAAALVTDVMLLLGQRGHQVAITAANGPRLVRLGALMLAEFGVGQQAGEEGTDASWTT